MMEDVATRDQSSWFQATARQRVAGLLDPNSFIEFLGPSERVQSPHLHLFDLPPAYLPQTVLLLLDSGGVRLQEANAGELAVAELMRALVQARSAGVAVIALVGGKSGAFGGAGLTAATCSRIAISEQGRIGVSGSEVIETNMGVEESMPRTRRWSGVPTAARIVG